MNAPKRTVLFDLHQKLGARMTVFGGFEMPVSYSGIIEEHLAVRNSAGIFDLSHMGEFEISGPHALATLERAFTNSAARLKQGQAQYTIMCTEDGGTIDDLIVYRLGPERYMLCVNASNIEADREWIVELNGGRANFEDVSDATALIAVQGPVAVAILATLADFPIADVRALRRRQRASRGNHVPGGAHRIHRRRRLRAVRGQRRRAAIVRGDSRRRRRRGYQACRTWRA